MADTVVQLAAAVPSLKRNNLLAVYSSYIKPQATKFWAVWTDVETLNPGENLIAKLYRLEARVHDAVMGCATYGNLSCRFLLRCALGPDALSPQVALWRDRATFAWSYEEVARKLPQRGGILVALADVSSPRNYMHRQLATHCIEAAVTELGLTWPDTGSVSMKEWKSTVRRRAREKELLEREGEFKARSSTELWQDIAPSNRNVRDWFLQCANGDGSDIHYAIIAGGFRVFPDVRASRMRPAQPKDYCDICGKECESKAGFAHVMLECEGEEAGMASAAANVVGPGMAQVRERWLGKVARRMGRRSAALWDKFQGLSQREQCLTCLGKPLGDGEDAEGLAEELVDAFRKTWGLFFRASAARWGRLEPRKPH